MIDHGGYALLLGVNIYRLSAMHCVEEAMPVDIKARFAPTEDMLARYPKDDYFLESFEPATKPWYEIQTQAYKAGMITDGMIGDSKCMLFQVKPVVELYREALLTRPYELYGIDKGGAE